MSVISESFVKAYINYAQDPLNRAIYFNEVTQTYQTRTYEDLASMHPNQRFGLITTDKIEEYVQVHMGRLSLKKAKELKGKIEKISWTQSCPYSRSKESGRLEKTAEKTDQISHYKRVNGRLERQSPRVFVPEGIPPTPSIALTEVLQENLFDSLLASGEKIETLLSEKYAQGYGFKNIAKRRAFRFLERFERYALAHPGSFIGDFYREFLTLYVPTSMNNELTFSLNFLKTFHERFLIHCQRPESSFEEIFSESFFQQEKLSTLQQHYLDGIREIYNSATPHMAFLQLKGMIEGLNLAIEISDPTRPLAQISDEQIRQLANAFEKTNVGDQEDFLNHKEQLTNFGFFVGRVYFICSALEGRVPFPENDPLFDPNATLEQKVYPTPVSGRAFREMIENYQNR